MNRPSRKQLTLQQLLMLRGTALLMGILLLLGAVLIPERLRSYDAALDEHIALVARLGAVDYLIKPFRYERFEEAMDKVVLRRKVIESGLKFTQADIDEMIRANRPSAESRTAELEKGIQRQTLDHIRADLQKNAGSYRTAEQIATDTSLSKVTVRRYLNYLIDTNEAESQVDYSTGGRPRVEYRSR